MRGGELGIGSAGPRGLLRVSRMACSMAPPLHMSPSLEHLYCK